MTVKALEQKILELEKRIVVLENTRVVVAPYKIPYQQPNYPLTPFPYYPTIC